ncbi:MAG: hypothetical protein JWQ32_1159 [Marmoricola sp.]|nr:hypothetical protein [Marmoricola sp.]
MDPENVRTIVAGVVTAAVGIVPAVLLYLQNQRSGEREATERSEQRASEEVHRTYAEQAARDESKERKYAAKRERYLRYSRSVEAISASIRLRGYDSRYELPEPLRAETAAAYEDVMLTPSQTVRAAAEIVHSQLDSLVLEACEYAAAPAQVHIERVEGALQGYRQACRNSLRPTKDNDA